MGKWVASGGVLALTALAVLLVALRAGLLPVGLPAAAPLLRAAATPQRAAHHPAPSGPPAASATPSSTAPRATAVAQPTTHPTVTPAHATPPAAHHMPPGSPHRRAPSARLRPGWTLLRAGGDGPILDLSCFDARRCLATGSLMLPATGGAPRAIGALLTSDDGLSW